LFATSGKYSISRFIKDALQITESSMALEQKKAAIGERLSELSRRDDLLRFGLPLGPSDGSNENYLLWREPPYTALVLGQFDPGYQSPVHEHENFWVVGCVYRGQDRWDMYERLDDGSQPGHAEVRMVDQWIMQPGKAVWMPPPPRTIHSHNNEAAGITLELIFSVNKPLPPERRLIYDVDGKACWPSPFNLGGVMVGDYYPPRMSKRAFLPALLNGTAQHIRAAPHAPCPLCATDFSFLRGGAWRPVSTG